MKYIVSIKPTNGGGPYLVTDAPRVVAAVVKAIAETYVPMDAAKAEADRILRTVRDGTGR